MKNIIYLATALISLQTMAQKPFVANYDESKISPYTLPDALKTPNGQVIKDKNGWVKQKQYWLDQYSQLMFGKMPKKKISQSFQLISKKEIMDGKAIQYNWKVTLAGKYNFDVLGVLPNTNKKVPVFLGLNFCGNQTCSPDVDITVFTKYTVCDEKGVIKYQASAPVKRGTWASRWQFEKVVEAGYGSITVACGDFEEDLPEGYKNGVRTLLAAELGLSPEEWSANGAWAWGLHRTVDFLEKLPQIDSKQIILHGHSRLGKAALWAGATDTRFAAIISNESGEGGAAITRRNYGETLWRITNNFPHWFLDSYKNYASKENELPFDSHILLSLLAPRPLYVASAVGDQWSDPKGEFIGAQLAEPVYALFGKKGLAGLEFPALNSPIGGHVRYHIREGNHDINAYDWDQYLNFAKKEVR